MWLKSTAANVDSIDQVCHLLNISGTISDPHLIAKVSQVLMAVLARYIPREVINP